jgi:hypothetical protein
VAEGQHRGGHVDGGASPTARTRATATGQSNLVDGKKP